MKRLAVVLALLCVACPCEEPALHDTGADVGADVLDSLRDRFDAERVAVVDLPGD